MYRSGLTGTSVTTLTEDIGALGGGGGQASPAPLGVMKINRTWTLGEQEGTSGVKARW